MTWCVIKWGWYLVPINWQFIQDDVLMNTVNKIGLLIVKWSQYKIHHNMW